MGFWDSSLRIGKCLCDHGKQSIRQLAQQTGFSQSSVHRLQQAMVRRHCHPESWFWETEEGRRWLTRLVVATLYTCGLKRGVGVETLSEFFARLRLQTQGGCSPTALRGVMQTWEGVLLEIAQAWEQDGTAHGEVREILGAVAETFLAPMMLVFLAVPTRYIVWEATAEDRRYATWKAWVDARLTPLGTEGLSLVSDRAKALIQLAEKGWECLSMPDFFHLMHDLVQSSALAMGQRLRQAQQERKKAKEALARLQGQPQADQDDSEAKVLVEARQAEVTRWEEAHTPYRGPLETLSLTLHPCRLSASAPQTSAQAASQLPAAVEAIEACAPRHQLPIRHDAMTKVRKQVPALAALVDFWGEGVKLALEHAALSPMWRRWAQESLRPLVSWEHQVARTRCARRKAKIRQALEAIQVAFGHHALTHCLPPQALKEWQAWATQRVHALQRASSAVEGRTGALSQLHHNPRGLPKHRDKVWTVLHNFDCRAADGTTPASRFFRHALPDLFETIVAKIDDLPRSRQRNQALAISA
jgi:Family of unknown function (DUF6399)